MSKLLINENPVMIVPSLALKIGLNEAVVLQQIHFWISISKHTHEGKKWVYNTYEDWKKQLPFWSVSTIKRTIHSLERQGFLITGNWNILKLDQTKWYSINYQKLEQLVNDQNTLRIAQTDQLKGQAGPSIHQERTAEETNLDKPIPKITSEISSEKNLLIVEIIDYLNEKANTNYKPNTKKSQALIKARLSEGFTLEDFKKVIHVKTTEWLQDPYMHKYLRPATLFGTKFESYLNQKPVKKQLREEDFDLND